MADEKEILLEEYSEDGFWNKLKRFARAAGETVIHKTLLLYYALQAEGTPAWAKTVIVGALAYFISPVDAIPDMVPVAGYTDDLGVLTAALATIAVCIDDVIRKKAREKLAEWFG